VGGKCEVDERAIFWGRGDVKNEVLKATAFRLRVDCFFSADEGCFRFCAEFVLFVAREVMGCFSFLLRN